MKQHGGKRKGAGRKPKYGEKTVTLCLRIPPSKKQELLQVVRAFLKDQEVGKNKPFDPLYGC